MKKAVTMLLSMIMILNILAVNVFANGLGKPKIFVNGNNVTINVQPNNQTTLVIADEKENRKYIDQSNLGNFKFSLSKGRYKAYISSYETEKFTVYNDVQVDGNKVLITGITQNNTFVTIEVKDLKGNRKHIDQTTSDNNGEYKFNFSLNSNEKYVAYIRSSAENEENHKINFETTNSNVEQCKCKLLPKIGSKNNEYNTEFSMEFEKEVKIVPSQNPQITLKAEKIKGTPKGEAEDTYEKKFKNVLKINPKNNKKVIIDLANEGDRLDVDYNYTVEVNKNCIVEKETNRPINILKDLKWTFNTEWKDKDVTEELYVGAKNKCYYPENDVVYVGDTYNTEYKAMYVNHKKAYPWEIINYPLKWQSLTPDLATVDRNGKVTVKSAGNAKITVSIPQSKDEHKQKVVQFFARPRVNRKLQVIKEYKDSGSFVISEDGTIYTYTHGDIVSLNSDLKVDNKFKYKTEKYESFKAIYKIDNRDYILTEIMLDWKNNAPYYEYRLIDVKTNKVYRKFNINCDPTLCKQYEENSSLFIVQFDFSTIGLYDAKNNKILWKYNIGEYRNYMYYNSGAYMYQGNIYVSTKKYIIKLNKFGKEIWKYDCTLNVEDIDYVNNVIADNKGNIYARILSNNNNQMEISLDRDGKVRWTSDKYDYITRILYIDKDGGIILQINEGEMKKVRTVKIDSATGKIIKDYAYPNEISGDVDIMKIYGIKFFGEYTENGETLLYTPRVIFDKDKNIVAYTDTDTDGLSLEDSTFKDGYIYRLLEDQHSNEVLQKLKLTDEYISKATDIDVKDVSMYENKESSIVANVLDQFGFPMKNKLTYEVTNGEDILTVDASGHLKARAIKDLPKGKYSRECVVNIKYEDGNIKLSKDVKVKVKQTPVPVRIYARSHNNVITSVTTNTGTNISPHLNMFVEDQHGEFMGDRDIKYKVQDIDIATCVLRDGPSTKEHCKYDCEICGEKRGETIVTAYLSENPKIKCDVKVIVEEKNYDLLWKIGTNGPWENKRCHHVEGISNDFIYCNENKIAALNKNNGKELWKSDVGIYYGMEISHPYIDKEGIVYVYDKVSTSVAAIDSKNKGKKLWYKSYGIDGIYQMDVKDKYIYFITNNGTMYKIDKQGNEIWKKNISDNDTKDMEVYSDDLAYVVSKQNVYKIYGDGKTELFFKENGNINVRDISEKGDILLEVSKDRQDYKAICLDSSGKLRWEKPIEAEFTAKWDKDKVYIVSYRTQEFNFKIYAYDSSGQEVFKPVNQKSYPIDSKATCFTKERKPIIKNNTIYVYIRETYGFDALTGKFKWKTYISDMYTPSPPMTLSVDDNNVIYSSSGAGGMFAYKIKESDDNNRFNITLNKPMGLKLNSLNEIKFTVTNNTDTKESVVISAQLMDKKSNKVISAWGSKKKFNEKESKEYSFGVDIPKSGEYKLIIMAMNNGKILNKIES